MYDVVNNNNNNLYDLCLSPPQAKESYSQIQMYPQSSKITDKILVVFSNKGYQRNHYFLLLLHVCRKS